VSENITQLSPEQQAPREGEERSRQLVRNAPVAMVVLNRKSNELELANDRFFRLFGYQLEDIPDEQHWWPAAYPEPSYRERIKGEWARLMEKAQGNPEGVERMEARVKCKDGVTREIEFHLSVFGDAYLVSFVDLTERKRVEHALREGEERLRLAAQAGKMYAFEWDMATDDVIRSGECPDSLGLTKEPRQGTLQEWFARVQPQDREKFRAIIAGLGAEKTSYQFSYQLLSPNGEIIWLEESGRAFFDAHGKIARVIGMVANVTERKTAEQALQESEERFRLAIEPGQMFACEWNPATEIIVRTAECTRILGSDAPLQTSRQEILETICEEDRGRVSAAMSEVAPEKPTNRVCYRVRRTDGRIIWLEHSVRGFFGAQGKMVRLIGMVADITERRRAEEALRKSEERFRLAAEAGKMYAYDWDPETNMVVRTAECKRILGEDAPLEMPLDEILAKLRPEDRKKIREAMGKLTPQNPANRVSYRSRRSDGTEVWLEHSVRALFDAEGKRVRLIGMVADINDRKETEQSLAAVSGKLIEAQEQERKRIARDLHDDINQRLALLNIDLQRMADTPPESQEALRRKAEELCRRTSEISSDVSALTRDLHSPKLELLGIVPAMRGFCDELAKHQNVTIEFRYSAVPSRLPGDVSLCLFRVMQEALRNALKYSGVQRFEAQLRGVPGAIELLIRDAGAGFDLQAVGGGRGLGMVSMRERVSLVQGTITIDSRPKGGTAISVRIPLAAADGQLGLAAQAGV
jgi:PAS domain S-box-containing protein